MKPRHSKLALLIAALFSFAGVQGQTVSTSAAFSKDLSTCVNVLVQERLQEVLEPQVAQAVAQSLKSLESLKGLETLSSLQNLSGLESLKALKSLEALEGLGQPDPDQPDLIIKDGEALQVPFAAEKTKNIARSFKVTGADKLSISNSFGRVDVQTWNRNEVTVEVRIITRASSEGKAQEILDKIDVNVTEGGNLISFATQLQPMQIRSSSEKSFEINYLVKMPKTNAVAISSRYGVIQLPDFDGPTDLTVKYGKLTTGRLNNRRNSISVTYSTGECVLEYVKAGDLEVKYSHLRLNGGEAINAATAYSRVSIDKVDNLAVESRYDTHFNVGSAGEVTGRSSYTSFSIGSISEALAMDLKYCTKFEVENISNNFKKVNLTGGYSFIKLGFSDKSAFNFDISTSYCGNPKFNEDKIDFTFKEVKNTSAVYRGRYGSSSPKGTVNVTNKYGSLAFH
ncbi:hypothetical protein [Rufibacter quisquiliarum]|uniref:Adhesin domain-containing protein n=1 Tax=Rufibacter quisquiliarum TaxID=1549639 RepID=A0A839GYG5_9BACT|nr:hypothetical protein [Rufibacter quisquiliarum]MBA9079488.1 hypothetical protein [Rufibacter quisquiliarum]